MQSSERGIGGRAGGPGEPLFVGMKEEGLQCFANELERIYGTPHCTRLNRICEDTAGGPVIRVAIELYIVPDLTREKIEEDFMAKIPGSIPRDVPIVLMELRKLPDGKNEITQRGTYHRDHPHGFEFVSPREMAKIEAAWVKVQQGREESVFRHRVEFIRWLIEHGKLSDDDGEARSPRE